MNRLLLFSSLYGFQAVLAKGFAFAVVLWMGKNLSISDFSNFGLLYALQQGVVTFGIAGITESIVGVANNLNNKIGVRKLYDQSLLVCIPNLLLVSILALLFYFLQAKTSNINLEFSTYLMALGAGWALAFANIQAGVYRLQELHINSLVLIFFPNLASFLCGAIAVKIEKSSGAYFLGALCGSVSVMLFLTALLNRKNYPRYGNYTIKIAIRVIPYTLIAFLGWLLGYGNSYLISYFLIPDAVARFTFIFTLSGVLLIVSSSLMQVWSPYFYKMIRKSGAAHAEEKNYAYFSVFVIFLSFMSVFFLFSLFPVLDYVGGNLSEYSSLRLELLILFSSYIIYIPAWHAKLYYVVYSKGVLLLKVVGYSSALGLLVTILLINLYGELGVYIGIFFNKLIQSLFLICLSKSWCRINTPYMLICISLLFLLLSFIYMQGNNEVASSMFLLVLGCFLWKSVYCNSKVLFSGKLM